MIYIGLAVFLAFRSDAAALVGNSTVLQDVARFHSQMFYHIHIVVGGQHPLVHVSAPWFIGVSEYSVIMNVSVSILYPCGSISYLRSEPPFILKAGII
jgi:hypothetical protein